MLGWGAGVYTVVGLIIVTGYAICRDLLQLAELCWVPSDFSTATASPLYKGQKSMAEICRLPRHPFADMKRKHIKIGRNSISY